MSSIGYRVQYYCYHKAYGYMKFTEDGERVTFSGSPLLATKFNRKRYGLSHFNAREWRAGTELLLVEDIEVQCIRVSWAVLEEAAPAHAEGA